MKSQSITYLLRGSERTRAHTHTHIYRILGLQGDVHSIWDLWTSGLQGCKGELFWNRAGQVEVVSRD